MGKNKKVISERALLARINRKVAADGLKVKKCRWGIRAYAELGDYYSVDENRDSIEDKKIPLEEWGRELGVLADYEQVAQ